MKKSVKITVLIIVICILMTGCDANKEDISDGSADTLPLKAETELSPFEKKIFILPSAEKIRGIAASGNGLLMAVQDENDNFSLWQKKFNLSSESKYDYPPVMLELPFLAEYPHIYDISPTSDGGFIVLAGEKPKSYTKYDGSTGNNPDFAGNYVLAFLDSAGRMSSSREYKLKEGQGYLHGTEMLPDGTVCLMGMNNYVLLKDGETEGKTFTIDTEAGNIFEIAELGDERILLCYDYGTGEYSFAKIYPDVRSPKWTVLEETDFETAGDEYFLPIGEELYIIDFENKRMKSFAVTSCTAADSLHIDSHSLLIAGSDGVLTKLSLINDDGEKKIIKAALCDDNSYFDDYLKKIRKFNQQSNSIKIETEKYDCDNIDIIRAEIAAGHCPDLIIGFYIDKHNDNFIDLYPYIDKDGSLSRENFVPGLLEALEYKGELHEIWDFFEIYTLIALKEDVPENFVLSDYENLLDKFPQREYLLPPWIDSSTMLSWCGNIACARYIEGDECSFDSEGLGELLKFCKALPEEGINDDGAGRTLLYNEAIQGVQRLSVLPDALGGEVTYLAFPGDSESKGIFSPGMFSSSYAIPEGAVNKDEAWEFIRFCLLDDSQYTQLAAFPVIKDALEKNLGSDDEFKQLVYSTKYAVRNRQGNGGELTKIIYQEGMKYLDGGKPLEEVINTIQSRVSIYLAENGTD